MAAEQRAQVQAAAPSAQLSSAGGPQHLPQAPQMSQLQLNSSIAAPVSPIYLLFNRRGDLLYVVLVWAFKIRGAMSQQTRMRKPQSVKALPMGRARQG